MARTKRRASAGYSGFNLKSPQTTDRLKEVGINAAGAVAGKAGSELIAKYIPIESETGKVNAANAITAIAGVLLAVGSDNADMREFGKGLVSASVVEVAEGLKGENNDAILSGIEEEEDLGRIDYADELGNRYPYNPTGTYALGVINQKAGSDDRLIIKDNDRLINDDPLKIKLLDDFN